MEIDKSLYKSECPICKSKVCANIINYKEGARRYYCTNCSCEFEISARGKVKAYRLTEQGHCYQIDLSKIK